MKDLKKVKYLILDMDGCIYHPKYLKTLFGQVSTRMTEFISVKLGIDKIKAKEIFKDSFPKIITVARLDKRKGHQNILMTIKKGNKTIYVLRPDYINTLRMFKSN